MKLLIIEDEKELSDSIVAYLGSEHYVCEQAFTYNEAVRKMDLHDYDCILLDLMFLLMKVISKIHLIYIISIRQLY